MKPVYFRDWITHWHWGVRTALFLMLLSALMQLGLFAMTQHYMVAYLGAQPEDISFALMATYGGIITVIPLQFRFFRYFETRSYLLVCMMLAILLNILCVRCQDINLFFVIRFFQGILAGSIIVFTLLLIFSRLPAERVQIIAPAVFYGTMLSNTVLIGLMAGVVVESADWKMTYYYLIFFQLMTLLIVLLMLRKHAGHKRYPLYQIDWYGMIILACSAMALAYTIIYGSKYYWLADPRIRTSMSIAAIGSLLFLYRQHIIKRPLIHIGVFKSRHFVTGICLLAIYYGSKDSVNLIYNYAGGTLGWSTLQVIELAMCNLTGMVALLIICIRLLLAQKIPLNVLLIIGFALMGAFNLWMCFLFAPDLSFANLLLPVFLQGAASGLLFVPLMIYVLSSAPKHTGITGLVIAAYTRFTATLNSMTGFYDLQLYFNQYFKTAFVQHLSADNANTMERLSAYRSLYMSKGFSQDQALNLAYSGIWRSVTQQSQFLTTRSMFMTFAILMFVIATLLIIIPAVRKTLQMAGLIKSLTVSET